MANQGQQGKQGKPRPGNREREGNLGSPAGQPGTPTGTSGRQHDTGIGDDADVRRKRPNNDDEESGLGNRTFNR